ncbi:Epimerase domain-containing protein [Aphelenchoides fujianensis]|nr:Epimerase domain-containing protein [Aphelenchoides fujianensis]
MKSLPLLARTSTITTRIHRTNATNVGAPYRFLQYVANVEQPPKTLITGGLGQLGRIPYSYLNILDQNSLHEAVVNHNIDTIIHFSALLSAVGENNVPLALQVNSHGVENVLEVARAHHLKVFIPSTIGAFGPSTPRQMTPDLTLQRPRTIYGVTKVYAELLGEYYHSKFNVDFRSLRFPGIISAIQPGGGTTDYAIQIFFDALTTGRHVCYLRPDTQLPMMFDEDCMASVVQVMNAPSNSLRMRTYNVTGFSFTPAEIAAEIRKFLPDFLIEYQICPVRQAIADSWPRSLNDQNAREDWGWAPEYDLSNTTRLMLQLVNDKLKAAEAAEPKVAAM